MYESLVSCLWRSLCLCFLSSFMMNLNAYICVSGQSGALGVEESRTSVWSLWSSRCGTEPFDVVLCPIVLSCVVFCCCGTESCVVVTCLVSLMFWVLCSLVSRTSNKSSKECLSHLLSFVVSCPKHHLYETEIVWLHCCLVIDIKRNPKISNLHWRSKY